MAAQSKLFQRLIWLVDTIYSAGHISRDEIDRRWSSARYNDMHETEYGERNFHRHREAIAALFGWIPCVIGALIILNKMNNNYDNHEKITYFNCCSSIGIDGM